MASFFECVFGNSSVEFGCQTRRRYSREWASKSREPYMLGPTIFVCSASLRSAFSPSCSGVLGQSKERRGVSGFILLLSPPSSPNWKKPISACQRSIELQFDVFLPREDLAEEVKCTRRSSEERWKENSVEDTCKTISLQSYGPVLRFFRPSERTILKPRRTWI